MISVNEAIQIATSEKLSLSEQKAYDTITNIIDNDIKTLFDGKSIDIMIEGRMINGSSFYISNYVNKHWRISIIMDRWKREYASGGWFIKMVDVKNTGTGKITKKYNFSIDPSYIRDEKISKLFE